MLRPAGANTSPPTSPGCWAVCWAMTGSAGRRLSKPTKHHAGPLDSHERALIEALDRSGVLLSGMIWLERLLLEKRILSQSAQSAAASGIFRAAARNLGGDNLRNLLAVKELGTQTVRYSRVSENFVITPGPLHFSDDPFLSEPQCNGPVLTNPLKHTRSESPLRPAGGLGCAPGCVYC